MWQAGATLHRGARGPHCHGPSCCGAQAPDAQAQQLWLTGLATPRHVGSSQTRARTRVPCIGRQTLNHCATREGLSFLLKHICLFILFNFLCLCRLDETVTYPSIKGMSSVGTSLCSLCVPTGFGGRAGSEVSTGYVFSRGTVATNALVGCRAGVGGSRARAKYESGLLLCSMAVMTLSEVRVGPKGWSRSCEGVGSLLGVMTVSILVGGVAKAQGLGAVLLCWFDIFPQCVCPSFRLGWGQRGWSHTTG